MGTRAAFWIGDPRQRDQREWLGCKAWDGYPENVAFATILAATDEAAFRAAIAALAATSKDFAHPAGGWPYPWADDVFVTDFTYAIFGGETHVTCFQCGFQPARIVLQDDFEWPDEKDPTLRNVPADSAYNPAQPDSIMILRIPK